VQLATISEPRVKEEIRVPSVSMWFGDWSSPGAGGVRAWMGLSRVDLLPATMLGRNRNSIEGRTTSATSRREACVQGAVLMFASYNACFFLYILFYAHFLKHSAPKAACAAVQARTDWVGSNHSTSGFDHRKSAGLGDQVSWLGATWDKERVVGISFTFFSDPETREEGEYNPHRYSHAEIHFARGEVLL
jgi:hypothetical protein